MTEKVKKTTTTAKARKPAVKKAETAKPTNHMMPSHAEIEKLARTYWEQRGYQDGFAEQDWLRAEHELHQKAS